MGVLTLSWEDQPNQESLQTNPSVTTKTLSSIMVMKEELYLKLHKAAEKEKST